MDTKYSRAIPSKPVVERTAKVTTIKEVQIQSRIDSVLKYDGPISGKHYVWEHAGAIVSVNSEDADGLLTLRIGGNGCCGASKTEGIIFQLIN